MREPCRTGDGEHEELVNVDDVPFLAMNLTARRASIGEEESQDSSTRGREEQSGEGKWEEEEVEVALMVTRLEGRVRH